LLDEVKAPEVSLVLDSHALKSLEKKRERDENYDKIYSTFEDLRDDTLIKQVVGQAYFDYTLIEGSTSGADMLFAEIKMNPINIITPREGGYDFYLPGEVLGLPIDENMLVVRDKSVLLPRILNNVFKPTYYVESSVVRRCEKYLMNIRDTPNLDEWEGLLDKYLPSVRKQNEDAFYCLNDVRGLLTRQEISDTYIMRTYERVFIDNPTVRWIALVDPNPRELDVFKRMIGIMTTQEYFQDASGVFEPEVIVYTPELEPHVNLMIMRTAFSYCVGKRFKMRREEDFSSEFARVAEGVFDIGIGRHIGVSRLSVAYDCLPVGIEIKYSYRRGADATYGPHGAGINAGFYCYLPHRLRNVLVVKGGVNFSNADWSLVGGVNKVNIISIMILRLEYSVNRNILGLCRGTCLESHKVILGYIQNFKDKYVTHTDSYVFNEIILGDFMVYLQDDKKRVSLARKPFDLQYVSRMVSCIPVGKENALPSHKLQVATEGFNLDEVLGYAVRAGIVAEDTAMSSVKYYIPKATLKQLDIPSVPRSNVLVTDGYAVNGNLNTPNPVIMRVDDLNKSFYSIIFKGEYSTLGDHSKVVGGSTSTRDHQRGRIDGQKTKIKNSGAKVKSTRSNVDIGSESSKGAVTRREKRNMGGFFRGADSEDSWITKRVRKK